MKKIILLFSNLLLSLIGFAQNEMYYNSAIYEDSLIYVQKKIDITFLKENNLISKRLADSITSHIENFMIRDRTVDYRILVREFGINQNWGQARVTDLMLGNYTNYYSTYQDTITTNFFDLIFSNNLIAAKELASRLSNELIFDKSILLDSICIGYTVETNRRVVGKLVAYTDDKSPVEQKKSALLLQKEGVFCWYVDFYSFSKATKEEKEMYEQGVYYLDK